MATKAKYWAYVNSVSGGGVTVRLKSAISTEDNWGTAIEGTEADWDSSDTHQHGADRAISSTGWQSWELDMAYIPLGTGEVWFRMSHVEENDPDTKNVIFRTEEYSGTGSDPYLEIYEEADAMPMMALTGVGL